MISKKWSLVTGIVLICVSTSTFATDSADVKVAVTADYFSKYIWRGQNLNNQSVFQPTVSLGKSGFTGSVWGSMDLTGINSHRNEFTEFDYTLDYSAAIPGSDIVGFSLGTIHYTFPGAISSPTTEIYGGLNFNVPLTPYIKIYRDTDEINGSYIQLGIGHSIEKLVTFDEKCYCGLVLGASTGWGDSAYNKGYFGVNDDKFNDLTLSAGLPVCNGPWTIKPSINYSTMLSDAIRSATTQSDNLWGGISISRNF
jgi:hypothetical protein